MPILIKGIRRVFCIPACQKDTTSWIVYHSTLETTVDEEYMGIYFCPGCDESTMVYRQSTSSIATPPHKPNISNDVLRFEHRNTTSHNRKICYVPIDCETSIRQVEKLTNFSAKSDVGGHVMRDEKGMQYELLSETDIGFVDCAKCRHGVQIWVQVRRFDEGRNTKWGLAIKSREGKCFLETALGIWCKRSRSSSC